MVSEQKGGRRPRWWWVLGALGALAGLALAFWVNGFRGTPFQASRHTRPPVTPAWALECWLWEDDVNTAARVHELLEGYARNDIPVRTILIDSPWSDRYNDFQVDTRRYPDPEHFFAGLKTNGYRVVLWMTSLVNRHSKDTRIQDSPQFLEEARRKGYLAGDGREIRWWKGVGAFIDYSNPEAMAWWHGMQDQVFRWGLDGWKLDGADTLFSGPGFIPYQKTRSGWMSTRAYMDRYAREEYRHGLSRNPEFITLIRSIDDRYFPLSHPEGFAPLDAAPVTWVGDRTHEWSSKPAEDNGKAADAMRSSGSWVDHGFEGALRDILAASALGYAVVGDDVGGYHGREPIPPRLYIRWAQFAAFTGLFLNGGHGERRLWMRTPAELAIIRKFAWLHTELVPYLYTLVVRCNQGGPSLIRPLKPAYQYLLGDDLLVSPIHNDTVTNAVRFPAGVWHSFLGDDPEAIQGPCEQVRSFAIDDFPAFVREGAIVPMNVSRGYTGFGTIESRDRVTWAIWPGGRSRFELVCPDGSGTSTVQVAGTGRGLVSVQIEGVPKLRILRIFLPQHPTRVTFNGAGLVEGRDWRHDRSRSRLWITDTNTAPGTYQIQ